MAGLPAKKSGMAGTENPYWGPSGKYMGVYSFIPSFSLGEGIPHKIDAFFQPLINEVNVMYINGITVNITQPITIDSVTVINPGNYQVRLLLLLGTADLKGHQEITLYAGDMVIDRMHLTFNMLKREFIDKMWADMGDNKGRPVNSRQPEFGGLINHGEFGHALDAVYWPTEEKQSGVAKLKSLADKLGSWKSNEFKKFSSIAREVLAEKIPSKSYDCYMLLCDAVQMLYSKEMRNRGWSVINIGRLYRLLWSHAIRAEECYGLGYCTENLEYSVHAAAEIWRHSSMDNYSCELYERAIRFHKKQKNNSKGLEKTFAERQSIKDFLECYTRKNGPISTYSESDAKFQFNVDLVDGELPFFFNESSYQCAVNLLTTLKGHQSPSIQHALKCGVPIGQIKRKAYPNPIMSDIKRYFTRELGQQDQLLPDALQSIKCVALFDQYGEVMKLTKFNVCKLASTINEEWIMEIEDIIQVGPLQGHYYTFINGKYFIPAIHNGQVLHHQWTGTPQYVKHAYRRDSVQPLSCVRRKVMMYPEPSHLEEPTFFLCNDFKNPELEKVVQVPIYPEVDDTVKVRGRDNEEWYGKVNDVSLDARKVTIQWYKETARKGVWVALHHEDEVHFRSLIGLAVVTRSFGGFEIIDIED
ncbi:hypothetical protein QZH41_011273 [Actinostola sp. cb2023]|nr:hypothetical protein QZH41_011273 [Actinostola sp. cb2023]